MTTTEIALPVSVNPQTWNADTAAMMEFAGLVWVEKRGEESFRVYAPPGIIAGFIGACRQTGLDPTAKQIYAAVIGGKWTILIGIDGMRVVAQRSGQYDGQDPIEWQYEEDGPWTTVPKANKQPYAARATIYRKGVGRPLIQVVTWAEFGKTTGQWKSMPAHQLGIRAESHAFRRLFPMELSGLYTPEDFETDAVDTSDAIVVEPTEDWRALIDAAASRDEIVEIVDRAKAANELTDGIRTAALARHGAMSRAAAHSDAPAESSASEPVDAEVVEDTPVTPETIVEPELGHEVEQAPGPEVDPATPSAEEWAQLRAEQEATD